jgi:dihydrofolate synthase/folylpolyglutamate synthase
MQKRGSKLDRMRDLELVLGSPSKSFRKVHVAGTNGKGSVSTKIASALTQAGYKTGLYTSPHIHTMHERIMIDDKPISEEDVSFFMTKILEVSREATFFEVMTLLAFLYFQMKEVDFAVIETGVGGALDPTNVILPDLSVITSISMDHMNVLGNSLHEIAENKAGIIKPNTPVVLGSRAFLPPVYNKAFLEKAPMYILPPEEDWMIENTEIAKKAVSTLFPNTQDLDFSKMPPCRFEKKKVGELDVIFDIAHNEDGLIKLFHKLEKDYAGRKLFVIFGTSQDKNVDFAVNYLKEKASAIMPFDIENPRIMRRVDISTLFNLPEISVEDFLQNALMENGLVVVTGSAYIMHKAKELIEVSSLSIV